MAVGGVVEQAAKARASTKGDAERRRIFMRLLAATATAALMTGQIA
jgi:hypothetical protein